jgi:hypothetical protein
MPKQPNSTTAKKPRSQEAKKPRSQEAKKPRSQEAKKPRQADDAESGWRHGAATDEALSFLLSYPASLL